jgi:hypothetical protein
MLPSRFKTKTAQERLRIKPVYTVDNEFGERSKIVVLPSREAKLGWAAFYVPSLGTGCVEVRLRVHDGDCFVTIWGGDDTGFRSNNLPWHDANNLFDWATADTIRINQLMKGQNGFKVD